MSASRCEIMPAAATAACDDGREAPTKTLSEWLHSKPPAKLVGVMTELLHYASESGRLLDSAVTALAHRGLSRLLSLTDAEDKRIRIKAAECIVRFAAGSELVQNILVELDAGFGWGPLFVIHPSNKYKAEQSRQLTFLTLRYYLRNNALPSLNIEQKRIFLELATTVRDVVDTIDAVVAAETRALLLDSDDEAEADADVSASQATIPLLWCYPRPEPRGSRHLESSLHRSRVLFPDPASALFGFVHTARLRAENAISSSSLAEPRPPAAASSAPPPAPPIITTMLSADGSSGGILSPHSLALSRPHTSRHNESQPLVTPDPPSARQVKHARRLSLSALSTSMGRLRPVPTATSDESTPESPRAKRRTPRQRRHMFGSIHELSFYPRTIRRLPAHFYDTEDLVDLLRSRRIDEVRLNYVRFRDMVVESGGPRYRRRLSLPSNYKHNPVHSLAVSVRLRASAALDASALHLPLHGPWDEGIVPPLYLEDMQPALVMTAGSPRSPRLMYMPSTTNSSSGALTTAELTGPDGAEGSKSGPVFGRAELAAAVAQTRTPTKAPRPSMLETSLAASTSDGSVVMAMVKPKGGTKAGGRPKVARAESMRRIRRQRLARERKRESSLLAGSSGGGHGHGASRRAQSARPRSRSGSRRILSGASLSTDAAGSSGGDGSSMRESRGERRRPSSRLRSVFLTTVQKASEFYAFPLGPLFALQIGPQAAEHNFGSHAVRRRVLSQRTEALYHGHVEVKPYNTGVGVSKAAMQARLEAITSGLESRGHDPSLSYAEEDVLYDDSYDPFASMVGLPNGMLNEPKSIVSPYVSHVKAKASSQLSISHSVSPIKKERPLLRDDSPQPVIERSSRDIMMSFQNLLRTPLEDTLPYDEADGALLDLETTSHRDAATRGMMAAAAEALRQPSTGSSTSSTALRPPRFVPTADVFLARPLSSSNARTAPADIDPSVYRFNLDPIREKRRIQAILDARAEQERRLAASRRAARRKAAALRGEDSDEYSDSGSYYYE
ncbi:uncharacterized protein AMSG_07346 [Thecamonas trahens ATCC 50062]|uniref:Uncharacterized protein n=1 Tax=Thecamonas trahens ATCC 50062 TaxID=461836 RepID=A0A0L0DG66_THETB|nr:hypothetical protein AMSG_07346 [Thecamonas trahens ATCC 50062]KNC51332.1 hypothetical protein AMSG_07346 [Thecamonas trahens ATCC 50062]|eukprot:XP_013756252.1 hypothetical protein AMSG_07346 [Thecamonas trahens ATCC 50062]